MTVGELAMLIIVGLSAAFIGWGCCASHGEQIRLG